MIAVHPGMGRVAAIVARLSGFALLAAADLAMTGQFFPLSLGGSVFVAAKWALAGLLFEGAVYVGRRRRYFMRTRWVADRPQVRAELRRYEAHRRQQAAGSLSEPAPEPGGELGVASAPAGGDPVRD